MRIGFEAMLAGPEGTGVQIAIRETLRALAHCAPNDEFMVYTHARAISYLPVAPNIHYSVSLEAGLGRLGRIWWQQVRADHSAMRDEIDIYHGPGYVVGLSGSVPSVVSVYDTIALDHPRLTRRLNAYHYRWAVPRGARRAKAIVVPSIYTRERCIALGLGHREKFHVVPLGVAQAPVNNGSRAALDLVREPFFLFVGTLERKKNLPMLLRAFAGYREAGGLGRLILAGKESDDAGNLRKISAQNGLDSIVEFLGYVSHEALGCLYQSATALLYPSTTEGFGLPPLEAMACGTPAIVSDGGAIPEICGRYALVVPSTDGAGWTQAMISMETDAALRERLAVSGRVHAMTFTWVNTAKRLLDLYREVIQSTSRIPRGH